jgi:5-hydroxyisourate hydrolase
MSPITTHVLDTARGLPAMGVPVRLEWRKAPDRWDMIGRGTTNTDGRVADLLPVKFPLEKGLYRMVFDTGAYFGTVGVKDFFYPCVAVDFEIKDPKLHYHVPLLLSPFGYSTYRGS